MSETITEKIIRGPFEKEVEDASGQRMADCYQCGKCSAGCPMVEFMDLLPHQVMHMVQIGRSDKVLGCKTIWLCASCQMCTTRCPQEVEIAHVMDTLRELSLDRNKMNAGVKDITTFHKVFLESLRYTGRLFEAGLVGFYKMFRPSHAFEDLAAGLKMGLAGKLKIFPHFIKDRANILKIFKKSGKRAGSNE